MFKNTFQSGFLSILYSIGSKPLQIWDKQVRNGHIKRITDQDIQSSVLEIMGTNVSTNHITCPADKNKTLGIKLPFLVMIIKNVSPAAPARLRPLARDADAARPCAQRSLLQCALEGAPAAPGAGRRARGARNSAGKDPLSAGCLPPAQGSRCVGAL